MESRNIIIILVIVVVVLAAAVGVMFLSPSHAKEDSKLTITSNETLYEGDSLTVKLTDINGTAIPDQTVRVTITNESETYESSVITNGSGIGVLELDEDAGNYSVNCSYGGNDNYTANNASQKLVILKEVVEQPVVQQSSSSYSSTSSSSQSDNRPAVDSGGVTREEADYWGWQYTPEHGGHYIGAHDHWDEKAGVYHD